MAACACATQPKQGRGGLSTGGTGALFLPSASLQLIIPEHSRLFAAFTAAAYLKRYRCIDLLVSPAVSPPLPLPTAWLHAHRSSIAVNVCATTAPTLNSHSHSRSLTLTNSHSSASHRSQPSMITPSTRASIRPRSLSTSAIPHTQARSLFGWSDPVYPRSIRHRTIKIRAKLLKTLRRRQQYDWDVEGPTRYRL